MKNLKKLLFPYIFVTILGVLLHFTYEWSGENFIVGLFSATNESTWEHLKLAFFPMFILTIWQIFHTYKNDDYFLAARVIGILSAMFFIVVAFYTFTGVTGRNVDFVNIAIYFLGVAFGFLIENFLLKRFVNEKTWLLGNTSSIIILFFIALLFIVLTYNAPDAGIFREPNAPL